MLNNDLVSFVLSTREQDRKAALPMALIKANGYQIGRVCCTLPRNSRPYQIFLAPVPDLLAPGRAPSGAVNCFGDFASHRDATTWFAQAAFRTLRNGHGTASRTPGARN
jgi:hypothetical protein